MLHRIGQALRMEGDFYQQAAIDSSLNSEVLVIIVGLVVAGVLGDLPEQSGGLGIGTIATVVLHHVGRWALWPVGCGFFYLVASFFGGSGTVGGLMRAFTYAYIPSALDMFIFIPTIGWPIAVIGGLWSILLTVVALRESMNVSSGGAVATILVVLGTPAALFVVATVMSA